MFVGAKCKHIPDDLWRWQANIVTIIFEEHNIMTKIFIFFEKIALFGEKIDKNTFQQKLPPGG